MDIDHVTNQQFVDAHIHGLTIADHIYILAAGHLVQLTELLLFHVVVARCHHCDDDHGQEDGETLDPSFRQSVGGNAQSQRHHCSHAQDTQHLVLETFHNLYFIILTISQSVFSGLSTGALVP